MLGCVAYTMCFYVHPFLEGSKLAISKGKYVFPSQHKYTIKLCDLIRVMLTPDPSLRPDIFEIVDLLNNFDSLSSIPLNVTHISSWDIDFLGLSSENKIRLASTGETMSWHLELTAKFWWWYPNLGTLKASVKNLKFRKEEQRL